MAENVTWMLIRARFFGWHLSRRMFRHLWDHHLRTPRGQDPGFYESLESILAARGKGRKRTHGE